MARKHYAGAFKMKGKPVVKVDINFCVKGEMNTKIWTTVKE